MDKVKKCPGKESFQRMNYLYQVSNYACTANASNHAASLRYMDLLTSISKKAVQRLDIDLKRTICKGCHGLLLVGITCKVKIKKRQARWTCTKCKTVKVFDLRNKDHTPWAQQEESVVEVLDYQSNSRTST